MSWFICVEIPFQIISSEEIRTYGYKDKIRFEIIDLGVIGDRQCIGLEDGYFSGRQAGQLREKGSIWNLGNINIEGDKQRREPSERAEDKRFRNRSRWWKVNEKRVD